MAYNGYFCGIKQSETAMRNFLIILITCFITIVISGARKPAYQIFLGNGDKATYEDLLTKAENADVVLFGEQHNNPVAHWLQRDLAGSLYQELGDSLILGAEMFERDDQKILNEYLDGLIKTKFFEREAKLWDNYETDYKPLVKFAKSKGLPFIGTNIPRRYANYVAYNGSKALDTFKEEGEQFFHPLPIRINKDLPGYQKMTKMGTHGGEMQYLAEAQAVKDATMGHFIIEYSDEESVFLHFNGNFHSNKKTGIQWYLRQEAPELDVLTIANVYQESLKTLEKGHKGEADFVICTPDNMTKTY